MAVPPTFVELLASGACTTREELCAKALEKLEGDELLLMFVLLEPEEKRQALLPFSLEYFDYHTRSEIKQAWRNHRWKQGHAAREARRDQERAAGRAFCEESGPAFVALSKEHDVRLVLEIKGQPRFGVTHGHASDSEFEYDGKRYGVWLRITVDTRLTVDFRVVDLYRVETYNCDKVLFKWIGHEDWDGTETAGFEKRRVRVARSSTPSRQEWAHAAREYLRKHTQFYELHGDGRTKWDTDLEEEEELGIIPRPKGVVDPEGDSADVWVQSSSSSPPSDDTSDSSDSSSSSSAKGSPRKKQRLADE